MLTIRWGVYSLVMYVAALFYSVFALLLIEPKSEDLPQGTFRSLALASLFYSTSCIIILNFIDHIKFWYLGQDVVDKYRDNMVKLQIMLILN
jgi:hypothetical protein